MSFLKEVLLERDLRAILLEAPGDEEDEDKEKDEGGDDEEGDEGEGKEDEDNEGGGEAEAEEGDEGDEAGTEGDEGGEAGTEGDEGGEEGAEGGDEGFEGAEGGADEGVEGEEGDDEGLGDEDEPGGEKPPTEEQAKVAGLFRAFRNQLNNLKTLTAQAQGLVSTIADDGSKYKLVKVLEEMDTTKNQLERILDMIFSEETYDKMKKVYDLVRKKLEVHMKDIEKVVNSGGRAEKRPKAK